MKQLIVLTRRAESPETALAATALAATVLAAAGALDARVLDLPHPNDDARARFARRGRFAVDGLWWGAGAPAVRSFDAALHLQLEPHVGWRATDAAEVDPADVVKQVSFLWATDGVGLDEFRAHYRGHVEVARRHMPALWQYVQNDVIEIDPGNETAAGADGVVAISELWFRSTDDFLHRYFASPSDEAEFRSHEGFLDLAKAFSFICSPHAIVG